MCNLVIMRWAKRGWKQKKTYFYYHKIHHPCARLKPAEWSDLRQEAKVFTNKAHAERLLAAIYKNRGRRYCYWGDLYSIEPL